MVEDVTDRLDDFLDDRLARQALHAFAALPVAAFVTAAGDGRVVVASHGLEELIGGPVLPGEQARDVLLAAGAGDGFVARLQGAIDDAWFAAPRRCRETGGAPDGPCRRPPWPTAPRCSSLSSRSPPVPQLRATCPASPPASGRSWSCSRLPDVPAVMQRLGVSRPTVRNHLSAILARLQVSTRAEAVTVAMALGLVGNLSG